jgi:biopolymer transport protein ExbD
LHREEIYGKEKVFHPIAKSIAMAQIQTEPAEATKTKRKVHSFPKIDMTPMVDLGFLLITFFIFTTTLAEKNVTSLVMPREGAPSEVPAGKALTILLAPDNKVFAYEGEWEKAVLDKKVVETNYNEYSGIGNLIRQKQERLSEQKDELVLLIKPTEKASYANLIDALDEAVINGVKHYAVVKETGEEKAFVQKRN